MRRPFPVGKRNSKGRESGQALVEFAFVFMFWVIMVVAILEMVLLLHT